MQVTVYMPTWVSAVVFILGKIPREGCKNPSFMPELISSAKVNAQPPPGIGAGAGTPFPSSDAGLQL